MIISDSAPLEAVFACDMLQLTSEQREKHIANSRELLAAIESSRELPDAYSFKISLTASRLEQAAAFIVFERLCCPFLNFRLEVEAQADCFWLSLGGPQGVKSFLRAELGELLPIKL